VEYGERAEDCAVREVLEETGLRTEPLDLVGVYSDLSRDPRGHIVSTVFRLRVVGGELIAGDDAEDVALFDLDALPDLAFDHARIIADHLLASGRAR
jgi:8-oxo-dGTP diphosphatase